MTMTSPEPLAIEGCGLVKSFGAIRPVDGLDLSVPSGGVFALLGPNGAGKTTMIRIFAFSVSWIWTALGLALRSAQAVTVISFAVQLPLTFASNVFVSPATLPGWLRALTATSGPLTMRLYRADLGGS